MSLTPIIQEKDQIVDGYRIRSYYVRPDAIDPKQILVICHGTPWSSQLWLELAQSLAREGIATHLWDMPGYGQSEMSAEVATDLRSQMKTFAKLLDIWKLREPHVLAHDIGGAVALGAHLLHNSDFRDLFLMDIVTLEPWGSDFFNLVAAHSEVFYQLPTKLHAALTRAYIEGASHSGLTQKQLDTLSGPWLSQEGQEAFYRQISTLSVNDTRPVVEKLQDLNIDVTIAWGKDDPWVPSDQAERLNDAIPRSTLIKPFDEVGHLVPFEAPSKLESVILDWLSRSADV